MLAAGSRVLVVGHRGMLGSAVFRLAAARYDAVGADQREVDVADAGSVARLVRETRPALIVNCAAFTDVDACESRFEAADAVNGRGPGHLAAAAAEAGAGLVHVSTDYVFDGAARNPYREEDPAAPLSAYGRSKLHGEEAVRRSGLERWWIVRTSWLFGPGGKNFVDTMARLAGERTELRVVADQTGRPTYAGDLALGIFALPGAPPGVYHYANEGPATWHELAAATVEEMRRLGVPVRAERILPIRTDEYPRAATPPPYSVLCTDKFTGQTGLRPPHWRDALRRHLEAGGNPFPPKGG